MYLGLKWCCNIYSYYRILYTAVVFNQWVAKVYGKKKVSCGSKRFKTTDMMI